MLQHGEAENAAKLKILVVDLDGGQIGATLQETMTSFNGAFGQPTWRPINYDTNATYEWVRNEVAKGSDVWGAIVANYNATSNLTEAISNPNITEPYDSRGVFTLIYNEVRYKTVSTGIIYPSLLGAVSKTTARFQLSYGVQMVSKLPVNSTDLNRRALLQPMGYTIDNIKPFGSTNTFLYNTVMFVFPVLAQFFLILAMNGLFNAAGVFATWTLKDNVCFFSSPSLLWQHKN